MGNGEAKELICMTHARELRREKTGVGRCGGGRMEGKKVEKKMGQL